MAEEESGVPEFKDLFLFGWLFKGRSSSRDMEELLIFITPHILKAPSSDPAVSEQPAQKIQESLP